MKQGIIILVLGMFVVLAAALLKLNDVNTLYSNSGFVLGMLLEVIGVTIIIKRYLTPQSN